MEGDSAATAAPADTAASTPDSSVTQQTPVDTRPGYVSPEAFFGNSDADADAPDTPGENDSDTDTSDTTDEPVAPADPLKSLLALPNLTPEQRKHIELLNRRAGQTSAESKTARQNFDIAQGWHQIATRLIERAKGAGLDVSDLLEGADTDSAAVETATEPALDLAGEADQVLGLMDQKWHDGVLDQQEQADQLMESAASLEAAGDTRAATAARAQARQLRAGINRGLLETAVWSAVRLVKAAHTHMDGRFTRLSSGLESSQASERENAVAVEAVQSAFTVLDDYGKQRYSDLFVPGQRKFSERGQKLIPLIFERASKLGADPRDPEVFETLYYAVSAKHPHTAAKATEARPTRRGDSSAVVDRGAPAAGSPPRLGNGQDSLEDPADRVARLNRRAFAG